MNETPERRPGTVFVYQNDLEAITLAERAKAAHWRVVPEKPRPWGTVPPPARDLDELRSGLEESETVVFVEAPAVEEERRLREAGHPVFVIDHHLYINGRGDRLDRRRDTSSLEQFAALFPGAAGGALSPWERRVAANDRGYWSALAAEELRLSPKATANEVLREIRRVRLDDLRRHDAQAKTTLGNAVTALQKALDGRLREDDRQTLRINILGCGRTGPGNPELIVLRAPETWKGVLLDALYEVHVDGVALDGLRFGAGGENEKDKLRRLEELAMVPLEALILFERYPETGDPQAVALEYSGPARRRQLLDEVLSDCLGSGDPVSRLQFYAGGGGLGCYLGAEPGQTDGRALEDLAERLANALLEGNRPAERWAVTFLQVLEIKDDLRVRWENDGDRKLFIEAAGPGERSYLHRYLRPYLTPDFEQQTKGILRDGKPMLIPEDFLLRSFASRDGRENGKTGLSLRVVPKTRTSIEAPIAHAKLHFAPGRLLLVEWMMHGRRLHESFSGDARTGIFASLLDHAHQAVRAADKKDVKLGWLGEDDEEIAKKDPYPGLPGQRTCTPGVDTVADILDLTDAVRRVFSGYYNPSESQHIEVELLESGDRIAVDKLGQSTHEKTEVPTGWFQILIDRLLSDFKVRGGSRAWKRMTHEHVALLYDERSHVLSSIVGMGWSPEQPAAQRTQRMLLARQATVEPHGATHFYHPAFAEDELDKGLYTRFETAPEYPGSQNLLAVTEQSIVHWGYGWFAANVTVKHVASQYKRLYFSELVSASVFNGLSTRLACEYQARKAAIGDWEASDKGAMVLDRLEDEIDRIAERVRRIKEEAIAYANSLWFTDLSPQMQGRDLHRLLSARMPTRAHYEELMAEIARADDLEATDEARRAETRRSRITVLSTVVVTFLTVSTFVKDAGDTMTNATPLNEAAGFPLWQTAVIGGVVLVILVVGLTERKGIGGALESIWAAVRGMIRVLTRWADPPRR